MEGKDRKNVLIGAFILITLGILIILSKMQVWEFGRSWPLLLMVIALGTLIQRTQDIGGWVIGAVGLIFLVSENFRIEIYSIATFLLPVLMILLGIRILMKKNHPRDP